MKNLITQFWNNEDGVTAIEYAVMGVGLAVILGVIFGKDGTMSKTLDGAFKNIQGAISSAATK